MYGTVARMQMKPGTEEQLMALQREIMARQIPGASAAYIYKIEGEPDVYYLVAVFESKDAYFANAESAEQAADYEKLAALFAAEPQWHDGEVISAWSPSPAM